MKLTAARVRALLAGALCCALPYAALPAAILPPELLQTGARGVVEDHYPVRQVVFAGGVNSLADVVYSQPGGFRPLTLDLYLPPAGKAGARPDRPLVVFIHGGGWASGHARHSGAFQNWPGILAAIAARGYVVASLNHRLSSEAKFPAAIQDVKVAIRWLRSRSAEYGIDKAHVLVWGGSSGGELAALAATSCNEPALAPPANAPAESDCVQAALLWYPIVDLAGLPGPQGAAPSSQGRYLGCEVPDCPPETVRLASPGLQVTARTPPMLIIHGSDDTTAPVQQSINLDAALKKAGVRSELIVLPGIGHQFVGKSLEATHEASVLAITRSIEFIESVFPVP